ncbi:hypothetical protein D3C75_819250 [compost metagenome]
MWCPACGSEEKGKFCGKCGTALADSIETEIYAEEPASIKEREPDEAAALETETQQEIGAENGQAAAVQLKDQEPASAGTSTEMSFWNTGTLIYLSAGVALFGYTCIHYWN